MPNDVQSFEEDVLRASRERPVLVDFWAPWCGPCQALGPVLERLAAEQAERWTLVKVNTDQHPDLSRRYGIRGIPAVKLFVDGEVVDEFTGVLPDYAIRQWLDKAIPTPAKRLAREAEQALDAGDEARARELFEAALDEEPSHARAQIGMARLVVFDDPERARTLATGAAFAGPDAVQTQQAVGTLADLLDHDGDLPEGAPRDAYHAALQALRRHDFDAALEGFVDVVRRDRAYDDDGARRACVALFTVLGEQHPAVRKWRRTFDSALY